MKTLLLVAIGFTGVASAAVRRIVLEFVRNVGRNDIVTAWTDGFEKNSALKEGLLGYR
jgi:hypothetical protein